MAEGARRQTGADYRLVGHRHRRAGRRHGEKPVGTVFIGLATAAGNGGGAAVQPVDRETFKQVTANQALEMLRRKILKSTQSAAPVVLR